MKLLPIQLPDDRRVICRVELSSGTSGIELSFQLAPSESKPNRLDADTQVTSAIEWILELDATTVDRLMTGDRVLARIPADPGIPLPSLVENATVGDYRGCRSTAGRLVMPLVVEPPPMRELFSYQVEGIDWLLTRTGAILADDMGLGKTAQAISAILRLIQRGDCRQALVIAPRSLLATWEYEMTRWAPSLTRVRVVPPDPIRDAAWAAILGRVHVSITTYEQLRSAPATLLDFEFGVVVADEAHRIRNLTAQITQGFGRLRAERIWALTGTPIERDSLDLRTLLSLVSKSSFGTRGPAPPDYAIRAEARPFVLRRRKQDVLTQLPETIEAMEPLDLLPAQAKAYRAAREMAFKSSNEEGIFLKLINELRMICDADPVTGASSKVERICEIIDNVSRVGEKVVVFSYLLQPLNLLGAALTKRGFGNSFATLTGEMSLDDREGAIQRFRNQDSCFVLLGSSRVAGEGLTLTEANHVVFLNEWWNPSANAQARDRVVRIGQTRGVTVYHFRCRGTIEETLDRILSDKTEMFDSLVERLAVDSSATSTDPLLDELKADLLAELS